jgi:branched-chain amino acid transport system substrate-binding protein
MSLSRRFVLSCLSVLALSACTGSEEVVEGSAAEETILIGEYGSLTGAEATFGQSTHNGLMLAVDQFNGKGGLNGKKIAVKTYDDQGKTQEAGTAVTRLVTDDKVVAIVGEVASSLSLAGGRVAQQYGVPMISPSSTNPTVTQVGDMIFRVCFVDSFQGYVVAKFAREDLKANKIAVLYDQGQAYSTGLKDDFVREFTAAGGTIAGEPQAYTGGDIDFSAQLTTIRDLQPDAIFLPGYYTDVANIALQSKKLGVTAPLLGGDGWDSSELAKIAGDSIEGAYYANHYSHEEQRPAVQEFVKAYEERYKETPDGLAALGYDAGMLLFDAMKRSPSLGGKDLAAAISATKDFNGVTGTISIDAERNATKPAVIVQMRGGKPGYKSTVVPTAH